MMAIICTGCNNGTRAISRIAFTAADGVYQFVCDSKDHTVDDGWPIHIGHIFEDHPELIWVLDHKEDFVADLLDDGTWSIRNISVDDESFVDD